MFLSAIPMRVHRERPVLEAKTQHAAHLTMRQAIKELNTHKREEDRKRIAAERAEASARWDREHAGKGPSEAEIIRRLQHELLREPPYSDRLAEADEMIQRAERLQWEAEMIHRQVYTETLAEAQVAQQTIRVYVVNRALEERRNQYQP